MSRRFLCSDFGVGKKRSAMRAKVLAMVISVAMVVTMIPSMAFAAPPTAVTLPVGATINDLQAALATNDDVILSQDIVVSAGFDFSSIPNISHKTVWLNGKSFDITARNISIDFGGLTIDGDGAGGGIKCDVAGPDTDRLEIANVEFQNIVETGDNGIIYIGRGTDQPGKRLDTVLTGIVMHDCSGRMVSLHGDCALENVLIEDCSSGQTNAAQSGMVRQNIAGKSLTLISCIIRNNVFSSVNGNVLNTNNVGAGVSSRGSLTIKNSTISGNDNTNGSGGGAYAAGNVLVENSVISDNNASGYGGGIFVENGGNVIVKDSQITNNSSQIVGGVICSGGGTITLEGEHADISGNTASNTTADSNAYPAFGWSSNLYTSNLIAAIKAANEKNRVAIATMTTAGALVDAIGVTNLPPAQHTAFNAYKAALAVVKVKQGDLEGAVSRGLDILDGVPPVVNQLHVNAAKDTLLAEITALQNALDALRVALAALGIDLPKFQNPDTDQGGKQTTTGGGIEITKTPNVQKIRTAFKTVYIKEGDRKNFTLAYVLDTVGGKPINDPGLKVTSDNEKVVKVWKNNKSLKLRGSNAGKATVTITAQNGKTYKVKVIVVKKETKLAKFRVTAPKKMKKGNTYQLKISKITKRATDVYRVRFISSDKKVLTVDAAGKVTAVGKGKAKITIALVTKKIVKTITVK